VWVLLFASAACLRIAWSRTEQSESPSGRPTIAASLLGGPLQLDGRLGEPAWRDGIAICVLTQQSPRPGQITPYKTTVRVVADRDNVYFGFECMDPVPSRIAIHTMRRDGEMGGDDTVAVVLDTYGDRRTGYLFRINAAGARVDGLIAGLDDPSLDWDGIWDARTARLENGWSAEIIVPARTLSFARGLPAWNVNFERIVARDRTVLRWASPTLDSLFHDLSRAGTLTGIEDVRQGLGLDLSPHAVGRMKDLFQEGGRHWLGSLGLDAVYRITPQMAAVFTANTDFAETEVDSRQINLTRFPLFFPERRGFFLEGSNQYQFGLGLEDSFIPFFSRRVGLYQGQLIPISAGVKLNGRAGRWNIGMLDVRTRDTALRGTGTEVPGTTLFAGRLSYDATPRLRLGTLVTSGHPDGIRRNTLAGFDAVWRTSEFFGDKNLQIGGWAAFSSGAASPGDRSAWGFAVDYPNDLWECGASLNKFGDAFDPALGFLPRPGTRQMNGECKYKPRPGKDGPLRWIRQEEAEIEISRVTNHNGVVESWEIKVQPLDIELESGDRVELGWHPSYEYLPEPFEIAEGITLPAGGYRYDYFTAELKTSPHRLWEFGTTTRLGAFYSGRLLQQQGYLRVNSSAGSWQAGISTEQNFATTVQGKFVQRLYQVNLAYSFSPNLFLTSFLQYDTESQNLGNNMRLQWTLKPGNDLFIVWNRGWRRIILSPTEQSLLPETELLAVKLRWTFRR
jgi:hypothetical protein